MKRASLLIILIFSVSVAGCADDEYSMEKEYWHIQRQADKIFDNPDASPPNELARIVNVLDSFVRKYPDSNLTISAEFNIVRLYMRKELYDEARAQLRKIMVKHADSDNICSEAMFLIGNTYEMEDKWDLALEQYKKVIKQYPMTPKGMETPLYIANYYKTKCQPNRMMMAYQEATGHYGSLAKNHPGSPLAYTADTLTAECYLALKDWQNAIDTFNNIIEDYKDNVNVEGALMKIALIYKNELSDAGKAKETLERLIKEYPDGKSIKTASSLLKEIGTE